MRSAVIFFLSASLAFSQSAAEWKAIGLALDGKGKSAEALAAYQKAEAISPNDADLLVKIAKQYGDMMPGMGEAAKKAAGRKSIEYSRKAVAADSKLSESHLAVALSLGKNTSFMGNKEKLEASREIKTEADLALRLDRNSDYAHHMLGRWHQEMAGIGGGTRLLAKVVYGGVPKGTYQEALEHFDAARKLQPKRLIHQIEYGRTLAMMDREDEAKREIQKGLDMPNRDADDGESKARGRTTLSNL